jgi:ABC-type nitrate/sulfonate/bicarbonate transport system substrate-binding protein
MATSVLLAACGGSAVPTTTSPPLSTAAKPAGSVVPATSDKPVAASASPSAGASASAGAPAKPGTVRVMELTPSPDPNLSYALETQELGLFPKHGVNVDILHAGGGGPQKVQILVSGSADVVMTDIISQYSGQYQGADYTAFFAPVARFGVPVAAATNITSVDQLKGQQVAVPSLAGAARFLMTIAFDHFGVKDADIKWLAIPDASESLKAIVAGRVPAGYMSTAAIPLIQQDPEYQGKVHVLMDSTSAYTPPWPNFEFITKKSWLQQNPDQAERITEALLEMERTFAKDQNSYAMIANKIFPSLTVDQGKQVWKLLTDTGNWAENGGINFPGAQTALDTYLKAQNAQPNKNLSKAQDAFDTGPLKAALDKMGVISDSKDVPDWYKK